MTKIALKYGGGDFRLESVDFEDLEGRPYLSGVKDALTNLLDSHHYAGKPEVEHAVLQLLSDNDVNPELVTFDYIGFEDEK
jgi:hypothetical protein